MKKLLWLMSVACLSVGLVGCGGQETEPKDEGTTDEGTTDETVEQVEEMTVTIATHHVCGDDPYSDKVGTEGCMSFEESDEKKVIIDQIKEDYGITFEYVEYQTDDKVEEIVGWNLAGTADADVVRLNASDYNSLVKSGNLTEVTQFIGPVSQEVDVFGNDIPYRLGVVGDKNYGVARDNMTLPPILVYDIDILKDAGMEEMPNELWEKGEWNFETAREYFKQVQEYADSSSDLTYAFGTEADYVFRSALGANGVMLVEDGVSQANTEAVHETFAYLEELRNDGSLKIYATPYTDEDEKFKYALTDMKNIWSAAQSAWEKGTPDQEVAEEDKGGVAFTMLDTWRSDCCIRNSEKNYGVVPFPTNSDDAYVPIGRGDMFAIPISVDQDKIERLTEAMALFVSVHADPNNLSDWAVRNFPEQENAEAILQHLQDSGEIDPANEYSGGHDWSYTSFITEWYVDPTTLTAHLETLDEIITSNLNE